MSEPSGETLMWEARAAPAMLEQLVRWALSVAEPGAEVFRSDDPDPRVVVINYGGTDLPEAPREYVARPPHAWRFQRASREAAP